MIKRLFLASLLFAVAFQARAYEDRDLLKNAATKEQVRESLVMDQKWVTYPAYSDRQGWDKIFGDLKDYYIKRGEDRLDYEWKVIKATDFFEYERTGDRYIMQNKKEANNSATMDLFMAEMAEGKGRFIDQLINGVFCASEMTSWSHSAHNSRQKSHRALPAYDDLVFDLGVGQMANGYSWIYYFMKDEFDKVDPEISRRLRHELQKKVLDVYLNNDSFDWMARGKKGSMQNNWNPWCNSNALIAFMLLENDRDVLADAVYESMRSVDEFLNYIKSDGACEEGPGYWDAAAGKLCDYLEMLREITGGKVDLFGNKMVKDMGEYIYRSYIGDGWVVNFADANAKGGGNPAFVYRFGKNLGSEGMMHYAGYLQKGPVVPNPSTDLYRFFKALEIKDELEAVKPELPREPFTWYPETEFCYLSNEEGLFFAGKGGFNNESHNHNDVGSFILAIDRKPILVDAGVGTYRRQTFGSQRYTIWTMQSNYHNLPMINGVAQMNGAEYKASDAVAKPGYFSVNIAGAFPEEAKVDRWIRSYKLEGKFLRINDAFTLRQTVAPNTVNFLTRGDVKKVSDGKVSISVEGTEALFTYDPKSFTYSIETIPIDDPRLSNVWGDRLYRISLTAKKMVKKGNYSFSIQKVK